MTDTIADPTEVDDLVETVNAWLQEHWLLPRA